MYCPRMQHYVRLDHDGTYGRCGHMVNAKGSHSLRELDESEWLSKAKQKMANGEWPEQCKRCEDTERAGAGSVRINSIERHKVLHPRDPNYLIVGGVLDNICNSACQTCRSTLSTKIGSLEGKNYPRISNIEKFWQLPQERILEIDVNGGEPTASPNYKKILANIPKNVRILRMNTNCSRMIPEVLALLEKGVMVIVTMSLDGVGNVHDYVRWPILWKDYVETVNKYLELRDKHKLLKLDFWTTVSCLNVNDLPNIEEFAKQKNVPHSWAYLTMPDVYSVKHKNVFTEQAKHLQPDHIAIGNDNTKMLEFFVSKQDALRKIDINDYLSF